MLVMLPYGVGLGATSSTVDGARRGSAVELWAGLTGMCTTVVALGAVVLALDLDGTRSGLGATIMALAGALVVALGFSAASAPVARPSASARPDRLRTVSAAIRGCASVMTRPASVALVVAAAISADNADRTIPQEAALVVALAVVGGVAMVAVARGTVGRPGARAGLVMLAGAWAIADAIVVVARG